jgi:hypothetical protein
MMSISLAFNSDIHLIQNKMMMKTFDRIQRRDHNDLLKVLKLTRQIIYCLKGHLF